MAENHPIAFRFVLQAKDKGATIIHVDPRFTRTSALADIYAPIRAGSDIAFLGGLIRYILEEDLWFKEYALAYTNLVDDHRRAISRRDARLTAYFRALTRTAGRTNTIPGNTRARTCRPRSPSTMSTPPNPTAKNCGAWKKGRRRATPALQHPNTVYQILKRHYAAYTPEKVEETTGCPRDIFLKIAEALTPGFGPRAHRGVLLCGRLDASHRRCPDHSRRGTDPGIARQYRAARRRRPRIARSFEHPGQHRRPDPLQHAAELPAAAAGAKAARRHWRSTSKSETPPTGFWHNFPKYAVSLLRAWYGEHATPDNQWGFQWIPRIVGDHSQLPMTLAIADGVIRGLFVLGQNPVIGGSNSAMIQRGLRQSRLAGGARLSPRPRPRRSGTPASRSKSGELRPQDIKTEVFLMPAALVGEKDGTFTNTHRLVQWHDKVVEPPGDSRSETWFIYHLGRRLEAALRQ